MVRVVVGDDHVRHVRWNDAKLSEGPEDELPVCDHAGVDDDHRIAIEDEADAPRHAVVPDVAGVQQMMGGGHATA